MKKASQNAGFFCLFEQSRFLCMLVIVQTHERVGALIHFFEIEIGFNPLQVSTVIDDKGLIFVDPLVRARLTR